MSITSNNRSHAATEMTKDHLDAQYFRMRRDPDARALLLRVAEDYGRLARLVQE